MWNFVFVFGIDIGYRGQLNVIGIPTGGYWYWYYCIWLRLVYSITHLYVVFGICTWYWYWLLRSVDSVECDWYSDDRSNVYFDCLSPYTVANARRHHQDPESIFSLQFGLN